MHIDLATQSMILKAIKDSDAAIIILGAPAQGVSRSQKSIIIGTGEHILKDLHGAATGNPVLKTAVAGVAKSLYPEGMRIFSLSRETSKTICISVIAPDYEEAIKMIRAELEKLEFTKLASELTKDNVVEIASGAPIVLSSLVLPG